MSRQNTLQGLYRDRRAPILASFRPAGPTRAVAKQTTMPPYKIRINGSEREFEAEQNEPLLEAALRQGVMLPYSCKNGTCGSCKGRLLAGQVDYPHHPPLALDDNEQAAGDILLCQATACSDITVEAREIEAIRDIPVHKLPARVIEKTRLADNVMKLVLKLPRAQRLQFLAGQYLDILLPGGKRRAFSIASSPAREGEVELHVRHVEGGDFTGWVFDDMQLKDILRIEGPLGTFFIRHDDEQRPMIMMGGGTGFAPLKSMIEDLLAQGDKRKLHLFWGVRSATELYLHEQVLQWAEQNEHILFTSALIEPAKDASRNNFIGFVHEAVLDQYPDLSGFDIYMSGPPAMIDAGRSAFIESGAKKRRIFFDSFEFGLDVPIRVLARSH